MEVCGVDWTSAKHDVLVADAAVEWPLAARFAHHEKGLRSLCRQLVRLKVACWWGGCWTRDCG